MSVGNDEFTYEMFKNTDVTKIHRNLNLAFLEENTLKIYNILKSPYINYLLNKSDSTYLISSFFNEIFKNNFNLDLCNVLNNQIYNNKKQIATIMSAYLMKYQSDSLLLFINNNNIKLPNVFVTMNNEKSINGVDVNIIINSISKYNIDITDPFIREWTLAYAARYNKLDRLMFYSQTYIFNSNDVSIILNDYASRKQYSITDKTLLAWMIEKYYEIIKYETDIHYLIENFISFENIDNIIYLISNIKFENAVIIKIIKDVLKGFNFYDECPSMIFDAIKNNYSIYDLRSIIISTCNNNLISLLNTYT